MSISDASREQMATYWETRPHRSGVDLDNIGADITEMEHRRVDAQAVAEVDMKHYSAHRSRIMALQKAGRLQEALELSERCIATASWESRIQDSVEAPWFTKRASMLLAKLGRSDEARGMLQAYVSRFPDDRPPGKIHARLEKF